MTNRSIIIIKRDAKDFPLSAEEVVVRKQKDEADGQRDMSDAVKAWINERRESSKVEKIFSNGRLFAWSSSAQAAQ